MELGQLPGLQVPVTLCPLRLACSFQGGAACPQEFAKKGKDGEARVQTRMGLGILPLCFQSWESWLWSLPPRAGREATELV